MTSQKRTNETLKILKQELPQCFKKGSQKIPLAHDIHIDGSPDIYGDLFHSCLKTLVS